jgi:branched-chain amino acid transport system substrate-binding protein
MSAFSKRTCIQAMAAGLAVAAVGTPATAEWKGWVPGVTPAVLALKSSNTVTLGAALPLTGSLAATGRYYRDAYEFTVDKINANGGLVVAGKKYQLSLRLLDNKSNSKLDVRLYERLAANKNINLLLGSHFNDDASKASVLAEKYQVPIIQAGAASSRLFSRGYKYSFGMLPPSDDYFRSTVEMVKQLSPAPKTVALISGGDSFSLTLSKRTSALLGKTGLQVLDLQYSDATPNFANILTLLESKNPDVLLWSGNEAGAIQFIRQAKSRNIHPKLLAAFTEAVPTPHFRSALGDDANRAFGMTPWLPSERLRDKWFSDATEFVKAFEAKFGYAPDYHSAAAAAAIEAAATAVEVAGSPNRKSVREALASLDFESLYGRIRFGENGQIVLSQTVVQIQDGNLVEIFTTKFVNQPRLPAAWSTAPSSDREPRGVLRPAGF